MVLYSCKPIKDKKSMLADAEHVRGGVGQLTVAITQHTDEERFGVILGSKEPRRASAKVQGSPAEELGTMWNMQVVAHVSRVKGQRRFSF